MELLIDTATPTAKLGLAKEGSLIDQKEWESGKELSSKLTAEIAEILQKNNVAFSDINRVRVNAGPGGFTTLRIGVVTANTLAYALGISVCGIKGKVKSLEEMTIAPCAQEGEMVKPVYLRPPNITFSDKNS